MGAPVHVVRENGDCAWWCNACRVEARARQAPHIDTSHRAAPVCPSCGREQTAHVHRGPRDGDAFEVCCPRCKTRMTVTAHVTVTYSTEERT